MKGIAASMLAALGLTLATAVQAVPCQLSDVKQNGTNSLACAGPFSGNLSNGAAFESHLNSLTNADWLGADPDPLGGWLFGYKWNDGGGGEAGVFATNPFSGSPDTGLWSVDIGSYAEFVLTFKQGNGFAHYYFQSSDPNSGTYIISWFQPNPKKDPMPTKDWSWLAVSVRGTATQVPEPGALALLALGGAVLALQRRRKPAS